MSLKGGLFCILICCGPAHAACITSAVSWNFDFANSASQSTDGAPCKIVMPTSTGTPIYGTEVINKPQNGSVAVLDRTTVVYTPRPGFKGSDAYAFEWVGVYRGKKPLTARVNISVTVR